MSKRSVLMLEIGSYLQTTVLLTTEQHGAFLLLLMTYAELGFLPNDERMLGRIAREYNIGRWRKRIWPGISELTARRDDGRLSIPLFDEWIIARAPRLDVGLSEWERLRLSVFERDQFTCSYCGEPDLVRPHCDHVVPRSLGGLSTLENLATSCGPCNIKKGARRVEEWQQ